MEKEISKKKYTMKELQYKYRLMYLVNYMSNFTKIDIFDFSKILKIRDRRFLGIKWSFLKPLYIGCMLPEAYFLAKNRTHSVTYQELDSFKYIRSDRAELIMDYYGLKQPEFYHIFFSREDLPSTSSLLQVIENLKNFITKKYPN